MIFFNILQYVPRTDSDRSKNYNFDDVLRQLAKFGMTSTESSFKTAGARKAQNAFELAIVSGK